MASVPILEERRKSMGKTKVYLAKKVGVSRPYLDRLLEHPELCTFAQAEALSDELNIRTVAEKKQIFLA